VAPRWLGSGRHNPDNHIRVQQGLGISICGMFSPFVVYHTFQAKVSKDVLDCLNSITGKIHAHLLILIHLQE